MRLKTFSPSMYRTFQQCERKVQYGYIDHLCTVCFRGETQRNEAGEYVCKACKQPEVKAPQLQRGIAYDDAITAFIRTGGGGAIKEIGSNATDWTRVLQKLLPDIANKAAMTAILQLATMYPHGQVKVQEKIWIDAEWNLSPETGRTGTLVLDVLFLDEESGYAQVLDWKTGSLTKTKTKLKSGALEQYIDQLENYALGVLAKYPKIMHVDTACYFLDDPSPQAKRHDSLSYGRGENYQHVKERWTRILQRTMATEKFDPTQSWLCGYCPYSKQVGGPCVF